jgi:hypothetical protein
MIKKETIWKGVKEYENGILVREIEEIKEVEYNDETQTITIPSYPITTIPWQTTPIITYGTDTINCSIERGVEDASSDNIRNNPLCNI